MWFYLQVQGNLGLHPPFALATPSSFPVTSYGLENQLDAGYFLSWDRTTGLQDLWDLQEQLGLLAQLELPVPLVKQALLVSRDLQAPQVRFGTEFPTPQEPMCGAVWALGPPTSLTSVYAPFASAVKLTTVPTSGSGTLFYSLLQEIGTPRLCWLRTGQTSTRPRSSS